MFEFSTVKPNSKPIIFLGDIITFAGDWQEFFPGEAPVLNRGICGDTSVGVLRRIGQVTAVQPLAVFLMIGTNDPGTIGFSPADTAHFYGEIVAAIRRDSPDTLIYLQALLPGTSPNVVAWSAETTRLISQLADNRSVFFLNVREPFLENGVMAKRLTLDGTHLTAEGYRVWKNLLDPVIAELTCSPENSPLEM